MVGHPDLTETRNEMDEGLAGVMPDSWAGHARIAAFNQSDDLGAEATEFAVTLANRLAQKTDHSPEAIAKAAVKKAREA